MRSASTPRARVAFPTGLAIALAGFLLYVNTLGHGYAVDDSTVITENRVVRRGVEGIPTLLTTHYRHGYRGFSGSSYRPLPLLLFAAEWQLFPGNPGVAHLVNALLYGGIGLTLFAVLRRMARGKPIALPLLASLLFVAHPLHTESVANIKGAEDLLACLFVLLALLHVLRHADSGKGRFLAAAAGFFFLALVSKESAIPAAALFPLALHFFTPLPLRRVAGISALLALPLLAYLAIRVAIIGTMTKVSPPGILENVLVAAPDAATRLATAFHVLGNYLRLLVWPHPLVSDYSYRQIPLVGWNDPAAVLSLLAHAGALAFAAVRFRSKDLLAFAVLFYLVTLSIVSNVFLLIGSSMGERFLFLPSVGFCILMAAAIARPFRSRIPRVAVAAAVLLVYGGLTVDRNRDWRDDETLAATDVKRSPRSARLHYHLGLQLQQATAATPEERRGRLDRAIEELRTAISLHDAFPDAHDQLGVAYVRKGDYRAALESFRRALTLQPERPETFNNLGRVYFDTGDLETALRVFQEAARLDPGYATAHRNLGGTYAEMGRLAEAASAYRESLRLEPGDADLHRYLAQVCERLGDSECAETHRRRAEALDAAADR